MQQKQERFGLSVALSTPFQKDGSVDLVRLAEHATWCLGEGSGSVTLFGTTGEGASIGMGAREKMLGAAGGAGIPMSRIVSGIAASSIEETVAQTRLALEAGCKALLLAPPFYFKNLTDDGLFAWFSQLFHAVGPSMRDVILYHIPSVTAVGLSPALVRRLRDAFPGVIAGVKDSSGDPANTARLLEEHGDLAILVGDERQLAAGMRKGAQGSICGMANFAPSLLGPVINEGRDDPRIHTIVDAILALPIMAAVKTLIAHRRGDPGWLVMRAPLEPLTPAQAQALGALFDRTMETKAA